MASPGRPYSQKISTPSSAQNSPAAAVSRWADSQARNMLGPFSISFHQVAQALFRGDKVLEADALQLFPQPGHVDVQGILVHVGITGPEGRHEIFAGDHVGFVLQKNL